jgi:hypothetical protein
MMIHSTPIEILKTTLLDIDSYTVIASQCGKNKWQVEHKKNRVKHLLLITDAPSGKQSHRLHNVKAAMFTSTSS